ncbi:MAG: Aldehyde dehydrogenase [Alphaproteobacteria bacterium MarineAlpha5_Bin9]|nr:MAG: Aldehyde dehydrogenase [Alphaproteobacteria bacterium MarineAlpha5_Bin9]|tara:strand:+ start:11347 stop:12726 length:1380 start_codon:yes stop_codon:yes gene_type:complete
MLKTISPIDNSVYVERQYASDNEINLSLDNSKKALISWKNKPLEERKKLVSLFVDNFLQNSKEIEEELCKQMGRPISQCNGEMKGFEERARYMIDKSEEALKKIISKKNKEFDNFIMKEPLGTIFVIAPWNYPYNTSVNSIIPSLLAGNCVILKHSSQTPLCAEQLYKAAIKSEIPENVFQFLHLSHKSTAKIISDNRIDHVLFTGSVSGGKEVKKAIGNRFINAGLELGGKDPAYVRKDCNLKHAIENLADGSFYNSGQSCCGIERIYVDKEVYEDFVAGIKNFTEKYILDDPLKVSTNLGPVVRISAAESIRNQIKEAIANGAQDIINKNNFKISKEDNCYVSPSVLINVNHNMNFMMEETFGPTVGIMKVENESEAEKLMNDSPYGLTACIWTSDDDFAKSFGKKINTGTFFMNRCDYLDPGLAWTGVKDTGIGVTLSVLGFDHVTRAKSYHYRTI